MSIYLDNSATSYPKPESVYEAMDSFMRNLGTNAGRGNYARARDSEELIYKARKGVANIIGVKKAGNIVFTSNVTESLNIILKGFLKEGDTVLTSNIEHNAMWRPLHALKEERGIKIKTFNCTKYGAVDLDEIESLMTSDVSLVAIIHGSNVLGNILPLKDIIKIAKSKGIMVLADCAQTLGVYPVSIPDLDLDFLAFTGHKGLLGPMGTGGFYIKDEISLKTHKEGGTGSVSTSVFQPTIAPDRYEAGTMNMPGLAGLLEASKFIAKTGIESIRSHEIELTKMLLDGLLDNENIEVYGPLDVKNRLGLVTFNIKNKNPYDFSFWLDENYEIMVRAGIHCSPQAHRLLGTVETGAVRASVGYFNTKDDIVKFLLCVNEYTKQN